MAELADALDSGSVTSVNALTTCYKSRLEELLRVKINSKTQYAGMAELADALDSGSVTSVNALTTVTSPASKSCFV